MAGRKRAFRVNDLLSYKAIGAPTCTPDGKTVAFMAGQPDAKANKVVSEIWAWSADRGAWQVTFGGKAGLPQFSPRGDKLAFLSDRAGEKPQLFVMGAALCEGRKVTSFDDGVAGFRWSPDGRRLAVIAKANKTGSQKKRDGDKLDWWTVDADEPKRRLWVVNADGTGAPRQITADGEHVNTVAWTPDGKRLVYSSCPRANIDSQWTQSDLKVVSAAGRGARVLCPVRGHLVDSRIEVSANGKSVLLCEQYDDRDTFHDTAKVVDLRTGRKQAVARRHDRRGMNAQWLSDREVCLEADDGTAFCIYVCKLGGVPRKLPTGPGVAAQAAVAPKANRVFYVCSEGSRPDELRMMPLDGKGKPVALTDLNRGVERVALARTETVSWKSPDGLRIEGLLYLPPAGAGRKPYPLVLMPHGGPYHASTNSYTGATVPNVFCAAGYACLLPNFRGSTGRGRLFTRKIIRNWGDGPFADIMSGVDALIRRGVVNPRRMAVFGGSYGGYMTCWAVTHTRRFRCAVAVAAVTNLLSEWGATDIPTFAIDSAGGALPSMADRFWRDQSPLHHAHKVRTPTLIVTGEVDQRVHPNQSHEFYRALKLRGVETKLVLYPREPHGVSEPRHRLHYFKSILNWIDEHMGRGK